MLLLLTLVIALTLPFTVLGAALVYGVIREQRAEADITNRINKMRLVWFAMTREELFVGTFPWLKNDELKNMRGIN